MNALDAEREVRLPPWYVRYAEFDGGCVVLSDEQAGVGTAHRSDGVRFSVEWARLPFTTCGACEWAHKGSSVFTVRTLWEGDDPEEAERQFHAAEERLLRGEFSDER